MCVCVFSCSVVSDSLQPHGLWPARHLSLWDFPGKNTRVGCHFLLQRIFLTQESNPRLLHWQAESLPIVSPGKPRPQWATLNNKIYVQTVLRAQHFHCEFSTAFWLRRMQSKMLPKFTLHLPDVLRSRECTAVLWRHSSLVLPLLAAAHRMLHASSIQLCSTPCDTMDCSLPGSSVYGILQARIPEWVAIPISMGSSWPRDGTHILYLLHWQAGSLPLAPK